MKIKSHDLHKLSACATFLKESDLEGEPQKPSQCLANITICNVKKSQEHDFRKRIDLKIKIFLRLLSFRPTT